jgi:hypothetical protein
MRNQTHRIPIRGYNIRFWGNKKDAAQAAEGLTRLLKVQYVPKYAPEHDGWVIKSVEGSYYDVDGKVPMSLDRECEG